jgi:macrolide-specific efflux system membrane fusion protein
MIVLADEGHRTVTTRIGRDELGRVHAGEPARVTFGKGAVISGTVSTVDPADGPVHITIDENAGADQLGPISSVRIITAQRSNVLTVPNGAVIHAGAGTLVAVRRGNVVVKVPVTVGLVGDTLTEVTGGGLKPGDLVMMPDARSGVVPGLGLPEPTPTPPTNAR